MTTVKFMELLAIPYLLLVGALLASLALDAGGWLGVARAGRRRRASAPGGQQLASLAVDRHGLLRLPRRPITRTRLAGVAVLLAGVAVIQ